MSAALFQYWLFVSYSLQKKLERKITRIATTPTTTMIFQRIVILQQSLHKIETFFLFPNTFFIRHGLLPPFVIPEHRLIVVPAHPVTW